MQLRFAFLVLEEHPYGREMLRILLEEVSVKLAVKLAARLSGKKKNELYQLALSMSASGNTDSPE